MEQPSINQSQITKGIKIMRIIFKEMKDKNVAYNGNVERDLENFWQSITRLIKQRIDNNNSERLYSILNEFLNNLTIISKFRILHLKANFSGSYKPLIIYSVMKNNVDLLKLLLGHYLDVMQSCKRNLEILHQPSLPSDIQYKILDKLSSVISEIDSIIHDPTSSTNESIKDDFKAFKATLYNLETLDRPRKKQRIE